MVGQIPAIQPLERNLLPHKKSFGIGGSIWNACSSSALSAAWIERAGGTLPELDGTAGTMEEGVMWIALFSIASALAVGLSVAAFVLQANQGEALPRDDAALSV